MVIVSDFFETDQFDNRFSIFKQKYTFWDNLLESRRIQSISSYQQQLKIDSIHKHSFLQDLLSC